MNFEAIIKELRFKAVRSSGAGGQHVNKVASKVILEFDIANSQALDENQKELLYNNLSTRITKEKVLILTSEESRSQHKNKALVVKRLHELLKNGLKQSKPRKATKPTKSAVKKRLHTKKKLAEKKASRKKPDLD